MCVCGSVLDNLIDSPALHTIEYLLSKFHLSVAVFLSFCLCLYLFSTLFFYCYYYYFIFIVFLTVIFICSLIVVILTVLCCYCCYFYYRWLDCFGNKATKGKELNNFTFFCFLFIFLLSYFFFFLRYSYLIEQFHCIYWQTHTHIHTYIFTHSFLICSNSPVG